MNRDLVLQEWRRAMRTLQAAELLAHERYPEDAVSRAYYAVLHAAKAALLVVGVAADSHVAVRRMFGKHLILSGSIERVWARSLAEGMDNRLSADYDVGVFYSIVKGQDECVGARRFLDRIRRYLLDNGLTEDELVIEADDG